ncbi:copper homeostasis periplasmic binding protein CopC [Novosphingobium guangzhouense]|uniref:Copper resistance protein CopC n=1 Tax=Novosphingobium guangzhouense TaxID=1850347 RepID=A0A2K2FVJ7_9SPHN|nr:copper homeostasis periplasmic binding protein CopC [Novosphingobium guangzhouense]PNU02794.1 copper resistance protein CopC [Novosphingobium guangzhouense]
MRLAALAATVCVTLAALPAAAFAQPELMSATPAAKSVVNKPTVITLNFSEDLVASLSGIDLVMTGMPGMADHKPMPIKGMAAKASGKTLTATLPRPLPTGTYVLTWHAVAADQHRVEGSYGFTVR